MIRLEPLFRHCTEFIYDEWLKIFSYPFLSVNNWPALNNQITNRNTNSNGDKNSAKTTAVNLDINSII